MSFSLNFPLFLVVLSLLSAVISSVLNNRAARFVSLCLTFLSALANGIIFAYVFTEHQSFYYLMGHFPHPWGNELKIGPMETLFSCVFSSILFLCLLGGKFKIDIRIQDRKHHYYYVMADLIQASLLVLVYTNDVFTGYVFIEICTLSSCGLLMIRENGRTILASIRYLIFSLIGSGLFLLGVIFLYGITGHLLMPNLKESIAVLWTTGEYRVPLITAMALMTMGIAIKSGLCPFHLWMADTYGAAIPSSSAILSGLISKGYIFFLIKLIFDVFGTGIFYVSGIQNVLYVFGAMGIIIGSLSALKEDNIFRMIAYSSASQIGYIYMSLGMSPFLGVEAALFHILAHAITKPPIFLAASRLSHVMGEKKKFEGLTGAGYKDMIAGISFSFEAFSMIGLPLTIGFISKYMIGFAAFESTHTKMIPTLLVLAVSTVLNTMYFARTILRIYRKDKTVVSAKTKMAEQIRRNVTPGFMIAAVIFMVANLAFGILSRPFAEVLANALMLF